MAVDDSSGKQARLFPCLAILRYTVATVVTVLAVVVIVMVITVDVRPDDFSVSLVQGHVGTTDLWKEQTGIRDRVRFGTRTPTTTGATLKTMLATSKGPGGGDETDVYTGVTAGPAYTAVKQVRLEIILSVDNPSGRGTIFCDSINVTFRAGTGMEIGVLPLLGGSIVVKPQTSHKMFRSTHITNTTVLKNIATLYGGASRFTGTVEVTMNTSSVVLGLRTTPSIVKLACSPMHFSVGDATDVDTTVGCIKSNE